MIELLIGLAVASVVIYLWFRGVVLVAIFLTLGEVLAMVVAVAIIAGDRFVKLSPRVK